jgi:fermentation-respiration switch protein FrsA (DUF1100 family)
MISLWPGIAIGVVVVLYVGLCSVLYRRLFVPDPPGELDDFRFTPYEFQADYEELDLTAADGLSFGAWFFRQPGTPQVIIVSPGHKARRQDVLGISVALWRKGFNVITLSFRGMEASDRSLITMGVREVQELAAAVAYARSRVRGAQIGLLGFSMGASVSLLGAAGDPEIRALVLDSAYADLRLELRQAIWRAGRLPGWPLVAGISLWIRFWHGVRLAEASPIGMLSGLEPRPLFFIHGGADDVTSVRHSRMLYDAYRGPREIWVVQGAPHVGAYFADRSTYVERVAGFFARKLDLKTQHLRLVDETEEAG